MQCIFGSVPNIYTKTKGLVGLGLFICSSYQCCGCAFYRNVVADPDPGSQTNADPDPGQTFAVTKVGF